MATPYQRRSSKERMWRRKVRQWRSSGLSIRDFCAQRQLSEPSFYAWRRTIAERDASAAQLVPVQVVSEEKEGPLPVTTGEEVGAVVDAASGRGLELVVGAGRVLRIGPGFDAPTLRRLLALLEEGRP